MSKPILCVDFDGVIHSYSSGWKGATTIPDPPVAGALEWLWKATEWFDVQVYSSRSKEPAACAAMQAWMQQYAAIEWEHPHPMAGDGDGPYPIKFCHEKPAAFLTIDDRAICFEGDWSELDPADLLHFKPWNKRNTANNAGTAPHDWVPSTLGHGETMCKRCHITNREAAALGEHQCKPVASR